ncbi:MAG: hypothetical protein IPI73_08220 [Betaproteobacteria bacterium]|nr:hypothetical protein [Betaproteobacteria bacterium]
MQLGAGDALFATATAFTEAMNAGREQWGEQTAARAVGRRGELDGRAVLASLLGAVRVHR